MQKKIVSLSILLIISLSIYSQIYYLPINSEYQRISEYEALKTDNFHTAIKPYNLYQLKNETSIFSEEMDSIKKNSRSGFHGSIDPIANMNINYDLKEKNVPYYFDIGLGINFEYDKFSFHTDLYFSFINPVSFHESWIDSNKIIPQQGKFFREKNGRYATFTPIGYFAYTPVKYINIEAGNGKTFFGDGYRSLLLSDNSNSYPYFKTTVDIWKIKYIYQISRLKGFDARFPEDDLSNKYTVSHFLSFNIFKFLNFYMFETVIASPIDEYGNKRGFDVNYLNPVIFFRPVDLSQGSPDNVMFGIGGSLRLFKTTQLYGQAILDEFHLSSLKARNGHWSNKYGMQAGIKSYETFFIKNLYSQIEVNFVRPFTYSHSTPITCYGNYNQPLAHPLGANFKEGIFIISYTYKKLTAQAKITYAMYGDNIDTLNYGHDIFRTYLDRSGKDDGFGLGDGMQTKLLYSEFKVFYPIIKNYLYAEIGAGYRKISSNIINQENLLLFLGIKTPMNNRYFD